MFSRLRRRRPEQQVTKTAIVPIRQRIAAARTSQIPTDQRALAEVSRLIRRLTMENPAKSQARAMIVTKKARSETSVDMREPKMPAPRARRKAMKQSPAPIGCRTMT